MGDQWGATIPARGTGAPQYAAELRVLLVYFAAELRILLVYLSESLGRLGQNRGRPPGPSVKPPLADAPHQGRC